MTSPLHDWSSNNEFQYFDHYQVVNVLLWGSGWNLEALTWPWKLVVASVMKAVRENLKESSIEVGGCSLEVRDCRRERRILIIDTVFCPNFVFYFGFRVLVLLSKSVQLFGFGGFVNNIIILLHFIILFY